MGYYIANSKTTGQITISPNIAIQCQLANRALLVIRPIRPMADWVESLSSKPVVGWAVNYTQGFYNRTGPCFNSTNIPRGMRVPRRGGTRFGQYNLLSASRGFTHLLRPSLGCNRTSRGVNSLCCLKLLAMHSWVSFVLLDLLSIFCVNRGGNPASQFLSG